MATAPDTHPVGPQPGEGNPTLNDVATGTNSMSDGATTSQLDFYQAMRDFKLMFPNMDEDVIEAVLRANHGAVDDTIDQLLTMNVDTDGTAQARDVTEARAYSPIYMNQELIKVPIPQRAVSSGSSSELGSPPQYEAHIDPPSYSDCHSSSAKPSPSHSATPPKTSTAELLSALGGDSTVSGLTLDLEGATGGYPALRKVDETAEKTLVKQGLDEDFTPVPLAMPPMMSLLNHDYTGRAHTPCPALPARTAKRRYRDWNPPLLGTLPDDFLRFTVTPPSTPERHQHKSHSHHSTPEHHIGHHRHTPHHTPHHQPHHQPTPPHTQTQRAPKPSPQRSMSAHAHTMHGSKPKMPQVGRSQSLRGEPGTITVVSSRKNPNLRTVTATHGSEEISSNLIQRKIAENERARTCSNEMTPEQAQVLEDERLALLSQNEEFLQVLKRDTDFMKTLERDRMNATAFESPIVDPNRPTSDQVEGYGADHQTELGPFPFSQPLPKDENAEFRRQLSHMGGLSKKKFAALAKKFFTRKKKQKKILKDSTAPSTANLLEDEDTDEEFREVVHSERPAGYDQ